MANMRRSEMNKYVDLFCETHFNPETQDHTTEKYKPGTIWDLIMMFLSKPNFQYLFDYVLLQEHCQNALSYLTGFTEYFGQAHRGPYNEGFLNIE